MVTTRSAERRAAQQDQELALRTRVLASSPAASPSVTAYKRRSFKSAAAQRASEDRHVDDLDASEDGEHAKHQSVPPSLGTQLVQQTGAEQDGAESRVSLQAASTTESKLPDTEVEQSSKISTRLKRFSSEDLDAPGSKDALPAGDTITLAIGNVVDDGEEEDEDEDDDAPPEIASTRARTPKRKASGTSRGSSSRKKAKSRLETAVATNDSNVDAINAVRPNSTINTGVEQSNAAEPDITGPILEAGQGKSSQVVDIRESTSSATAAREHIFSHHDQQLIIPRQEQSASSLSSPIRPMRLDDDAIQVPSYSLSNLERGGEIVHATDMSLPRDRRLPKGKSYKQRLPTTNTTSSSNLPPKSASSKSGLYRRLMHSRPGFRTTDTWAKKRKRFAASKASSPSFARS